MRGINLGIFTGSGYSRAYLQFLIGLRNKSLKLCSNLLHGAVNSGGWKSQRLLFSVEVIFFLNFKHLLSDIRVLVLRQILKGNLRSGKLILFFRQKLNRLLLDFFFNVGLLVKSNYFVISTILKRFLSTIIHLLYFKKSVKRTRLSSLKRAVAAFSLAFAGLGVLKTHSAFLKNYLLKLFL